MNRRSFLTSFGKAAVAVALAAHLPVKWVPVEPRRYAAIEYLMQSWRAFMKGKGSSQCPRVMLAGNDLYDAYYEEILHNMRVLPDSFLAGPFTDPNYRQENLMFKAGRLVRSGQPGWWVAYNTTQEG